MREVNRRPRAREWSAWACVGPEILGGFHVLRTKKGALEFREHGSEEIVRVRVSEILPRRRGR